MYPTIEDIQKAHSRIRPFIHHTPILTCAALDERCGAKLYFKCENFQKVGAFKIRGATNAIQQLGEEQVQYGVVTHSSGNHGAAVALAARNRQMKATVVMPRNSSKVKIRAVENYGAEVILCEPTTESREGTLDDLVKQTGALPIHPFNDHRIIAGQGTVALELLEDVPGLDVVVTPVGGGGLLSGTALTVAALSPKTQVLAGEPKGADDAFRSFKSGKRQPMDNPKTIADGLRTGLGDLTYPIIRDHVTDILTVEEKTIAEAMRFIWERMKIIVEPSSAVAVATIWENLERFKGLQVGVIFSGGNVDFDNLPWNDATWQML